jgi:hypothetical protein
VSATLHAMDIRRTYLQMAHDAQAKTVLDRAMSAAANIAANAGECRTNTPRRSDSRGAMERQQWADAMTLPCGRRRTPYEAITHFARAIGAARAGKPAEAAADVARLAAIHDREVELKDAYWAEQVDIQRRAAEAWVAYASGQKDEGLRLLSAVADAESD